MKKALFTLAAFALLPTLQGCFPVVAAGVGTTVLVAEDRRTPGTYLEDQGIELKASNRVSEKLKDQVHVNITSYNRNVLITGEAPTDQLKREVEEIVRGVPNVTRVTNELAPVAPTAYTSRANDGYLTSLVKARFLDANKFRPTDIKVVTENGIVFLLGIVSRKEAEDATEIARTTKGVQKVVRVFEYTD